jgi:hypothetical protein
MRGFFILLTTFVLAWPQYDGQAAAAATQEPATKAEGQAADDKTPDVKTPDVKRNLPDYATIVQSTVDGHIRPAYGRLAKSSKSLAVLMEAACRTDEGVNTPAIAKSFRAMVSAWAAVQHVRFGPVQDENRYERIAFWPDPKNLTARQLKSTLEQRDPTAIDPDSLAKKSIALQGLTALERLMTMTPASDPDAAHYRCQFAQAITENLVRITSDVYEAWQPGRDFPRVLAQTGSENPLYRDQREAALEVLKSLVGGLQFLHERKLKAPLGDTVENARPKRGEFWRSGNALAALDSSFATLRQIYVESGISAYAKSVDSALDKNLLEDYDQALVTLKAVNKPFVEASADKIMRPKLEYLRFLAHDLFELTSGNLAIVLDLSLGFNALDGD